MSSVLITGGTGFLGHGLVRRLLALGHERVRVYSRNEFSQFRMAEAFPDTAGANGEPRLGFFVGDVRDVDRLERAMKGVEIVIHAAALKRIEVGHYNPDEMVKTNVLGTMNVIEAARRTGVGRVVLVSSDKAFEPVSTYGFSKAIAEELVLAANRQALGAVHVVCRYGNVAGSTGSVIPIWRERIAAGLPIKLTDPDCTRFWMHLEDAVSLVLEGFEGDETFLVPELPAYRLGDLAEALQDPARGQVVVEAIGLGAWEKKHESMGPLTSSETARRLSVDELRQLLRVVPA